MTLEAVLFDLDGTLLDTLRDLADSTNAALRELGLPGHATEQYRYFVGSGLETMVGRALPDGRAGEAMVRRCMEAVREQYRRRWADNTRPYPGVPALLDTLTERGMPLCVLSNKPHDFTCLSVGQLLPQWEFAVVRGAGRGTPLKPDPAAALELAGQVGVPPEEFAYVGDSDVDMHTAVRAGMYPLGAGWGFRTPAELRQSGARRVLKAPGELLEILGKG